MAPVPRPPRSHGRVWSHRHAVHIGTPATSVLGCGTPQRPTHLDHPRRQPIHTRTRTHRRTTTTTPTQTPTRTTTTGRPHRRTTTILRMNGGRSSKVTRLVMGDPRRSGEFVVAGRHERSPFSDASITSTRWPGSADRFAQRVVFDRAAAVPEDA